MAKRNLVISVSGGGALGIGPLHFMCRLEQDLGKKISDLSIAYAGTSTGAIIASLLDEGYSAHEVFDLYKSNLKKIFDKLPWYKRCLPTSPTYDNSYLKKMLKEKLKGKCSEWKKPIFIPTTYMNGESMEKVWDLGDNETEKWFAVLTSTAAPTYFDIIVENGKSYCDGGMWKNNPIDILHAGLKHSGIKQNTYKVLSFNTGMDAPNTDKGNKTLLGWGEWILKKWVAYSGKSGDYIVKTDIGYENVFVASPKSKSIAMDDVSDKTVEKVIGIWDDYYNEVKADILKWIK